MEVLSRGAKEKISFKLKLINALLYLILFWDLYNTSSAGGIGKKSSFIVNELKMYAITSNGEYNFENPSSDFDLIFYYLEKNTKIVK